MIDGVKLMDAFTATIVAAGLGMGGTGLYLNHVNVTDEERTLLNHCLSFQNDKITENSACNMTDIENAYIVHERIESANSLALSGLFVTMAGGMIGGTAGYARAFQRKMKNNTP